MTRSFGGSKRCHSLLQIRHSLHFLRGCVRELDKVPKAMTWPSDPLVLKATENWWDMLEQQQRQTSHRKRQLQNSLWAGGKYAKFNGLSCSGHKRSACGITSARRLQNASLLSSWSTVRSIIRPHHPKEMGSCGGVCPREPQ